VGPGSAQPRVRLVLLADHAAEQVDRPLLAAVRLKHQPDDAAHLDCVGVTRLQEHAARADVAAARVDALAGDVAEDLLVEREPFESPAFSSDRHPVHPTRSPDPYRHCRARSSGRPAGDQPGLPVALAPLLRPGREQGSTGWAAFMRGYG